MPERPYVNVRLHADDFGATATTTRQIAELWQEGALDGFSVLANGDALAQAAASLSAHPDRPAYIAVHLNLSEGRSIAPPTDVGPLVDSSGDLRHSFGSLVCAWVRASASERSRLLAAVETEWRAQIRAVRAAVDPRPVHALDGHIHVHVLPFLFPLAARLAREEGVRAIRIPREEFHVASVMDIARPWFVVNVLKHVLLRGLSRRAEAVAAIEQVLSPGRLVGVLYTGRMTLDRLRAGVGAAQRARVVDVEVAVHVGRPSEEERSRWTGRHAIWRDASHPHRDVEREAVRAFARARAEH